MSLAVATAVSPRWEARIATVIDAASGTHLVRRCADVAELVGVARAGLVRVAVVSADLRGVDRELIDLLHEAEVRIVGARPSGREDLDRTLRRWGVRAVVVAEDLDEAELSAALRALDAEPGTENASGPAPEARPAEDPVDAELRALLDDGTTGAGAAGAGGVVTTVDGRTEDAGDGPDTAYAARGRVVVVWGPHGSPGRTTVAVNLAAELAATGAGPVLLVDADTYGATVAQTLGLLDEAPGIAAAARAADQGTLEAATLHRIAPEAAPGLHVLTGLPRADRWTELREPALADVLEVATREHRWVVVDVAGLLEEDEELSFDTGAPRRNGATLTALATADELLAVGVGDPVGLQRLVRGLEDPALADHPSRRVVVTRVRPGAVGPRPARRIRDTLQRFAGISELHVVPEDREAFDAAMLAGRALCEVRPGSVARRAIAELAAALGAPSPTNRRGGLRRRSRRPRVGS